MYLALEAINAPCQRTRLTRHCVGLVIPVSKCGHGFRAMARTILDEVLDYPIEVIEMQLAHAVQRCQR